MEGTLRTNQIIVVSPRYAGTYSGGPRQRDPVHEEGTDWMWLLGTAALRSSSPPNETLHASRARSSGGGAAPTVRCVVSLAPSISNRVS